MSDLLRLGVTLHWGAQPAVLVFSLAFNFPPNPPSQLPYFSGILRSGNRLSGHFLLIKATPLATTLLGMRKHHHSPSLPLGWWPAVLSPLLPCYYFSLCIAKPFVTEIRDTINLWFFLRNWLSHGGRQLAHQLLRTVEFNSVCSLAMETVSFIL